MIGRTQNEGDAGFTLVEVLVAFAIVSLCLASLYGAISGHARQMAMTDMHRQTLAYAKSYIENLGETAAAQPGPLSGAFPNGTLWRLSTRPVAIGDAPTDASTRPFFVLLQVYDRAGHRIVALDSVKMLPVEP
jgi:general secretion pathway protein I